MTVDGEHPLRFERGASEGLKPYVRVRGDLWALVKRALFYDLVALGRTERVGERGLVWRALGRTLLPHVPGERNRGALSANLVSDLIRAALRALAQREARAIARLADLEQAAPKRHSDDAPGGRPPDPAALPAHARPAAVLLPIVKRPGGLTVLLTLRLSDLRAHSGQVAFPGGKIDPGETPREAALREAREEIGLEERFIEPLGWLDPYLTGTGFRVAPLVALVEPSFALKVNKLEVDEVFETPFAFLMDPANHRLEEREWQGRARKFYAMPHDGRYIWGATAGILRNLYEKLFS